MKPLIILALAVAACAEPPPKHRWFPEQYAAGDTRPYSCRLYDDEQRKCAFGSCDKQTIDRLRKECLRDGGRP
jgi:hypothetical protein